MGKGNSGFLSGNYFEKAEFTKIEVILLIGVLTIFLPFIIFPVIVDYDDEIGEKDSVKARIAIIDKFNLTEEQYDNDQNRIIGKFKNDIDTEKEKIKVINDEEDKTVNVTVENIIAREIDLVNIVKKEAKLKKIHDDEEIDKIARTNWINEETSQRLEDEFGKERILATESIVENLKQILNIHEYVYNHHKSYEYQNRIYIAFVIAIFLLSLTIYLSRKGYTSYTPWLEKLANDKLKFDLLLFQHVDEDKKYFKTKKFFKDMFDKKDLKINDIDNSELFGWRPIDENKKWYSVFSEKLDYRFYEMAFGKLWPEWSEKNYKRDGKTNKYLHDDEGDFIIKEDREQTLYGNPELVPDLGNDEIRKELELTINQTNQIKNTNEARLNSLEKWIEEVKTEETKELEKILEKKEKVVSDVKFLVSHAIKNLEKNKKIWESSKLKRKLDEELEDLKKEEKEELEKKLQEMSEEVKELEKKLEKELQEMSEETKEFEKKLEKELKKASKSTKPVEKTEDAVMNAKDSLDGLNSALNNAEEKKAEAKDNLERSKSSEIKKSEKEIEELSASIKKIDARMNLVEIKKLNGEQTCLDAILNEIDIFKKDKNGNLKNEMIVRRLLIRKIQNDILYYSVMINFRRGLQSATGSWLKADYVLKSNEKNRINEDASSKDAAGDDLSNHIESIVRTLENELLKRDRKLERKLKDFLHNSTNSVGCSLDSEEDEINKKINNIQCKLINRNEWETSEWRAMGSIYYKWREDGAKWKNEGKQGTEIADKTISEKIKDWTNRQKGIKKQSEVDPTEKKWIEHRTIRAVNSLSDSFGFDEKTKTGKAILFFGIVFALIISTALLNSLDIVIETMQLPLDCDPDCFHTEWEFLKSNFYDYQYVFFLFLCFFPLGILFYHQGSIFLSARAAQELTLGNKPLIFVNFLFILLQAIVVYFLASSIGDVNAFLSLLMLAIFVDVVWVIIFTWNDMRDAVRDSPVYLEWIILDIIIGMFAWTFSVHYASSPEIYGNGWETNWPIFVMLLVVLVTRAAVDYSYAWKNFWSMFADAE